MIDNDKQADGLNSYADGVSRTIKAQYGRTSGGNFTRTDSLGAAGVIERIGNVYPSQGQAGQVVGRHGIAPAATECHGQVTRALVNEPQVRSVGNRNPSGHGIGGEVCDTDGLAPTICVNNGSGYTISEPLRVRTATALGYDECPAGGGFDAAYPTSNKRRGRVQENGNVTGALTAQGDMHCVYEGTQPKPQTQPEMEQHQQPRYRIRKLTPRECYRLMDVDDNEIDKLLNAKDEKGKPLITKTSHYKLAGNSIVVAPLYLIFRNMFIDTKPTQPTQPTLF